MKDESKIVEVRVRLTALLKVTEGENRRLSAGDTSEFIQLEETIKKKLAASMVFVDDVEEAS